MRTTNRSTLVKIKRGGLAAVGALALLSLVAILTLQPPAVFAMPLRQDPATPTPLPGTGSIAGQAWDDRNGDGVQDPGEPVLAGVIVVATNTDTNAATSATTGADGKYRLTGLAPAVYAVNATPPAGYVLTTKPSYPIALNAATVVTLDFGAWQPPTPTPSPTPPPMLDTGAAIPLTCGGVYSGNTQAWTNNVSRYSCKPWWDESGREAVYRLQVDTGQPVTATLLSASADLDLFLLRYAYPDSCLAAGDNYLSYTAEPGSYFISVDGYRGAEGSYTFRVDCPDAVQATPTPTYTPSPTPTATQTGTPAPTATPLPAKLVYLPLVIRPSSAPAPIPATFTLQDDLNGYAGTTDTTLDSWQPTTPQGSEKVLSLFYTRRATNSTSKAPVVRFDLSLLPPGAIVQNATLRLYVPSTPLHDLRAEAQGLLVTWDEPSATWQLASADHPWNEPGAAAEGADRTAWASTPVQIAEGSRWYEFDVTPLVQGWAQDQTSNHGLVLGALAGDSDANVEVRFASREGAQSQRPQLVVTFIQGASPQEQ